MRPTNSHMCWSAVLAFPHPFLRRFSTKKHTSLFLLRLIESFHLCCCLPSSGQNSIVAALISLHLICSGGDRASKIVSPHISWCSSASNLSKPFMVYVSFHIVCRCQSKVCGVVWCGNKPPRDYRSILHLVKHFLHYSPHLCRGSWKIT